MALNFDEFQQTRHFRSMTGLRFICVLATVAFHVRGLIDGPFYLGVDMFFAISGFLIVTLLIRERRTTGSIDMAAFYKRRTLRIFPIYYLVIIGLSVFALAISPWAPRTLHLYALTIPVMLLYLQDWVIVNPGLFHHTWSLAMEEQFYLVWPSIERYARRLVWPALGISFVVCQLTNFGVLNAVIDHAYGHADAHLRPVFMATFTPILLGVAAAHVVASRRGFAIATRLLASSSWTPLLVLCLIGAVCATAGGNVQGWPRLTLHVLFCAFLMSVVLRRRHVFTWLLDHRWIEHFGAISYGIYVYHTVVLEACSRLLARVPSLESPLVLFVTATSATLLVAQLSFRYIEQPLLALKSRFSAPAAQGDLEAT